ncbi:RNA-directed DNA polymerase from mobile element jockey [Trichonephila clavipes]|nr:RNA-directed DNA polymerase from mobile element jockey [Trichonephila clavipes]
MYYPEARRVVLSRTPVSGKSYASAARKNTTDKSIQCNYKKDNSSDSVTPTKPEDRERFAEKTKEPKGSSTGSKTSFNKDPNKNIQRLPPKNRRYFDRRLLRRRRRSHGLSIGTFDFKNQRRSECGAIMASFISWNCRGLKTRLDDFKFIISTYQCVALQKTFLKRTMTMRVRGYNCARRDVDGDASPTGGVCLFTSNLYPSNVVTLHTSLQAVAAVQFTSFL